MNHNRENGLALFGEIYGPEMAQGCAKFADSGEGFGPRQAEWTLDFVFGQVWSSDRLARKLRSCTVLGMLIGQGAAEEIKYHTKMGIRNGLTRAELEEIFYTAIPYCGFPAAATAKTAMLAAFTELDAEAQP
ncbi:MAG: carboxymuconolactone decarboxylase family protein [Sphingomonadales bacterium]|nr:carboxymuconolactone decarboxylase family protein [Sphingomonadales bacterium]